MSRSKEELQGVTQLGNQHTTYAQDYDPSLLETFVNKHPDRDYFVKFNCPEFTSLCPIRASRTMRRFTFPTSLVSAW